MKITITLNATGNPPTKLADAELQFTEGPLEGLRLIGFGIWQRQNGSRFLTFPAQSYSVNGERRSFALLRPQPGRASTATEQITALVLEAYDEVMADQVGV